MQVTSCTHHRLAGKFAYASKTVTVHIIDVYQAAHSFYSFVWMSSAVHKLDGHFWTDEQS